LGRGSLEFLSVKDSEGKARTQVLAYNRSMEDDRGKNVTIIQNLSDQQIRIIPPVTISKNMDLLGTTIKINEETLTLAPYEFLWI
jgi:hypothetical protein